MNATNNGSASPVDKNKKKKGKNKKKQQQQKNAGGAAEATATEEAAVVEPEPAVAMPGPTTPEPKSALAAAAVSTGDLLQQQQQQQQKEFPTEETIGTPTKSNKKAVVSPLILARHAWLQEQETLRKRGSVSEQALQKLKEINQQQEVTNTNSNTNPSNNGRLELPSDENGGDYKGSNRVKCDSIDVVQIGLLNDVDTEDSNRQQQQQQQLLADNMSMELMSMDSLDMADREFWGDARRQDDNSIPTHPALVRFNSDATPQQGNRSPEEQQQNYHRIGTTTDIDNNSSSNNNRSNSNSGPPLLATLQVTDSEFLGFARSGLSDKSEIDKFVAEIQKAHPTATHIPYAWSLVPPSANTNYDTSETNGNNDNDNDNITTGWEEDGEPPNSTGPFLLEQVRESRHERDGVWLIPEEAGLVDPEGATGIVVVIVRYFGNQLLGVTCGRLSQCYQRIAQSTLHRLLRGCRVPQLLDLTKPAATATDHYGLAGGDTELLLHVVEGDRETLMSTMLEELDFGGFIGAEGEELPRLQNLQADFFECDTKSNAPVPSQTGTILPVYRYPGNYQGGEWETFAWSPKSLDVKKKVEDALPHFYNHQKMNHCVTNYYRHGNDFIGHHSDKDLDLDRQGAIVSLSIGAERIMELRRRAEPRDITRVLLPHGSMLLLGPVTNTFFTHSILAVTPESDDIDGIETDVTSAKYETSEAFDKDARISLTLRHVTSYMDSTTKRLYGQGVECKTLQDLKRSQRWDSLSFVLGFGSLLHYAMQNHSVFPTIRNTVSGTSLYSSSRATSTMTMTTTRSLFQEGVVLLGSISVALWSYTQIMKQFYKRRDEKWAREFFTKSSTSGTKY